MSAQLGLWKCASIPDWEIKIQKPPHIQIGHRESRLTKTIIYFNRIDTKGIALPNGLQNLFLRLLLPRWVRHIVVGFSISAGGPDLHSRSFAFIYPISSYRLFVCSYTPPFLCDRTRHCLFVSHVVRPESYTPQPRPYALPVVCPLGAVNKPPWFIHTTQGPQYEQTTTWCSFSSPRPFATYNA